VRHLAVRCCSVGARRDKQSRSFQTWRDHREQAHLSAEQPSSGQSARLPPAYADPRRSLDPVGSSSQGSQRDFGLISGRPTTDRRVVLPAAFRLRRATDFAAVVRVGRRAGTRRLVIHLLATGEQVSPRVGFVVSAKVGNSVVRHQVTRRLRHLVREHLGSLPPGTAVVIRALPLAATATSVELRSDLRSGLHAAMKKVSAVRAHDVPAAEAGTGLSTALVPAATTDGGAA